MWLVDRSRSATSAVCWLRAYQVRSVGVSVIASNPVLAQVQQIRKLIELLGPPILFRKMIGIQNALEMQVEDGQYQRHAVVRLCEALLATAELYDVPGEVAEQLEAMACRVIDLVERRR
jgi:hypothetical protein